MIVGHEGIAVGGDDLTVGGPFQSAVAGVGGDARGQGHLEVSSPLYRDVEIAAGGRESALGELHRDGGGPDSEPELDAGGQNGSVGGVDGARADHLLVVQICEFGAAGVVAGRRHVREVVRDDLDASSAGRSCRWRDGEGSHVCLPSAGQGADCRADALVFLVEEALAEFVGPLDLASSARSRSPR